MLFDEQHASMATALILEALSVLGQFQLCIMSYCQLDHKNTRGHQLDDAQHYSRTPFVRGVDPLSVRPSSRSIHHRPR